MRHMPASPLETRRSVSPQLSESVAITTTAVHLLRNEDKDTTTSWTTLTQATSLMRPTLPVPLPHESRGEGLHGDDTYYAAARSATTVRPFTVQQGRGENKTTMTRANDTMPPPLHAHLRRNEDEGEQDDGKTTTRGHGAITMLATHAKPPPSLELVHAKNALAKVRVVRPVRINADINPVVMQAAANGATERS